MRPPLVRLSTPVAPQPPQPRLRRLAGLVAVIALVDLWGCGSARGHVAGGASAAYAWGANGDEQLPTGVTALSVSAGNGYSLAVGSDGHAYAWGANGNGQLGDNTTVDRHSPVRVRLPVGLTALSVSASVGGYHSLAVGGDGHAYAWGYNGLGGSPASVAASDRLTPAPMRLPVGVTALSVSAGLVHSLAVGSDGHAYAWGSNDLGQLGDGATTDRLTPARVRLPAGVTALFVSVSAGGHSLSEWYRVIGR